MMQYLTCTIYGDELTGDLACYWFTYYKLRNTNKSLSLVKLLLKLKYVKFSLLFFRIKCPSSPRM